MPQASADERTKCSQLLTISPIDQTDALHCQLEASRFIKSAVAAYYADIVRFEFAVQERSLALTSFHLHRNLD